MKNNLLMVFLILFPFNFFAQTGHTVLVRDFEFVPRDIEITLGDTVTWQWVNGLHTTTSDATSGPDTWDEVISSAAQTFSFVISNEGFHRYYCAPHGGPNGVGMAGTITVSKPTSADNETNLLNSFELHRNYPNPFNPSTTITFSLASDSKATLAIFNIQGQEVAELINSSLTAGIHKVNFDAESLNSGIYFYRLTALGIDGTEFSNTKKMTLIK